MSDLTSFDQQLQTLRRLDWRFLLESPRLGDVAYAGPGGGQLAHALEEFSDRLTHLHAAPRVDVRFDLVVLERPDRAALERGLDRVRPGGFLYLEASAGAGGRSRARGHARMLESSGFRDVRVHWHWPDFESPTALLDARSPAALRYFLAQRRPGRRARLVSRGARALAAVGLLERCVASASVVAQRERT